MVLVAEKPPDNHLVRSHFLICQDNFLKENLVSEYVCACTGTCAYVCVCVYIHITALGFFFSFLLLLFKGTV